jgi:hypothetical protein
MLQSTSDGFATLGLETIIAAKKVLLSEGQNLEYSQTGMPKYMRCGTRSKNLDDTLTYAPD